MSETPVQVGQKLSAQSGSSSVFPSMFPTSPYPQTVGSNKAMRFRKRGTELLKAGSTYHEFGHVGDAQCAAATSPRWLVVTTE